MVWFVLLVGIVAGLVASGVMEAFQAVAARPFGAIGGGDPATVKAADTASETATGEPVTQKRRAKAGRAVHYATGMALGLGYVALVHVWPEATFAFGAAFGVAAALLLDDLLVPAFGWGAWPWRTPANIHAYSLVSHVVFGIALEGVRRLGSMLLG